MFYMCLSMQCYCGFSVIWTRMNDTYSYSTMFVAKLLSTKVRTQKCLLWVESISALPTSWVAGSLSGPCLPACLLSASWVQAEVALQRTGCLHIAQP